MFFTTIFPCKSAESVISLPMNQNNHVYSLDICQHLAVDCGRRGKGWRVSLLGDNVMKIKNYRRETTFALHTLLLCTMYDTNIGMCDLPPPLMSPMPEWESKHDCDTSLSAQWATASSLLVGPLWLSEWFNLGYVTGRGSRPCETKSKFHIP